MTDEVENYGLSKGLTIFLLLFFLKLFFCF